MGFFTHLTTFAVHPSLRSLSGHRHPVSPWASLLAIRFYRTSDFERSAVRQHAMHDHGEATGKSHAGFLQASAFRDLHGPGLECEAHPRSRQDRVGGLVEKHSHHAVSLLGDPSRPIEPS